MHYVGRRASETNPARSIPMFRPAHQVFGHDPLTLARMKLAQAEQAVPSREGHFASACIRLGHANRCRYPSMRRQRQAAAMREVNTYRAALRQARRDLIAAHAALAALLVQPELPLVAPVAIDPDLLPSVPRVLQVAVGIYEAGTIGTVERAKGWGWLATVKRPGGAGTVASHATREAAQAWLDAELAAPVMH